MLNKTSTLLPLRLYTLTELARRIEVRCGLHTLPVIVLPLQRPGIPVLISLVSATLPSLVATSHPLLVAIH